MSKTCLSFWEALPWIPPWPTFAFTSLFDGHSGDDDDGDEHDEDAGNGDHDEDDGDDTEMEMFMHDDGRELSFLPSLTDWSLFGCFSFSSSSKPFFFRSSSMMIHHPS